MICLDASLSGLHVDMLNASPSQCMTELHTVKHYTVLYQHPGYHKVRTSIWMRLPCTWKSVTQWKSMENCHKSLSFLQVGFKQHKNAITRRYTEKRHVQLISLYPVRPHSIEATRNRSIFQHTRLKNCFCSPCSFRTLLHSGKQACHELCNA